MRRKNKCDVSGCRRIYQEIREDIAKVLKNYFKNMLGYFTGIEELERRVIDLEEKNKFREEKERIKTVEDFVNGHGDKICVDLYSQIGRAHV